MNSYQAKKLSLPDIMARLGYEPVKIQKGGNEYWYRSPFRTEKEASFHTSFINGQWIWKDFGGNGGNIIEFVLEYQNYTRVSDALDFLDRMFQKSYSKPFSATKTQNTNKTLLNEKKLVIDVIKPLKHIALVQYLTRERAINLNIGQSYLSEIHFHNTENQKKYFALGMKNLSGGYEIRNPFFKSSLGGKDLSFVKGLDHGRGEVTIFEGYMDFLTYLTECKKPKLQGDVLILNSVSFAKKAKSFIQDQSYSKIFTFLDNDRTGNETLSSFKELPVNLVSLNHLYKGFKDYNQYWQHQQKQLNMKSR